MEERREEILKESESQAENFVSRTFGLSIIHQLIGCLLRTTSTSTSLAYYTRYFPTFYHPMARFGDPEVHRHLLLVEPTDESGAKVYSSCHNLYIRGVNTDV